MRLLVLGASGGVGRHLVRLALDQGNTVTALVRNSAGLDPRARVIVDDVLREGSIEAACAETPDAVVSALGIKRRSPANPWSALVSPPDFCSRTARAIVASMPRHGIRRVIAVSAAGVGDSAPRMNALMKFFVRCSNVGIAYRDLAVMEAVYAGSGLEWCCPRPTRLTHGPLTRRVSAVEYFGMASAISRADVAWWMLEHAATGIAMRTPLISNGGA